MNQSLGKVASISLRTIQTFLRSAVAILILYTAVIGANPARALEGSDGVFDPSSIVKIGSTYHIFCDGQGIVHKTSTDMVNWTTAGSVFGSGDGPSWIQTYLPGFTGYFWAPEIVSMGGKYYCYYACGGVSDANLQAIGCATSTNLTTWTDQGEVVYANDSTHWAGIDPSVCEDTSGNYWLTWGSWRYGIWEVELNSSTGKPISTTYKNIVDYSVSGGNPTDFEASKLIYYDGYYYCFYNQGTCCNGITSTYTIWVTRSTSVSGPFTGDRVFIAGSNPIYAPGQLGYFVDTNGDEYCTFHYDDGNSNGYPRLMIDELAWSGGWPVNIPNYIPTGTYKVIGEDNGLAWTDGTGASLGPLTQATYTAAADQKFVFTNLGWNLYDVTTANTGLAVDCLDCDNTNGTLMDIYGYWGGTCQQYDVFHASDGSYVLSTYNGSGNGTDVIDNPGLSDSQGTQMDLWSYNGGTNQKWLVEAP